MKTYFSLCLAICLCSTLLAQKPMSFTCSHQHTALLESLSIEANNSRSDTIDILNYEINLDISDISTDAIEGNCVITLTPKIEGVTELHFDLESLNVYDVEVNNLVSYEYNSPLIKVTLSEALVIGEATTVNILYGGEPVTAAFGGFYFTNFYAYNLGVGIGVDPPNFGRAWFPCFDNFVERSTFKYNITTADNHKAMCGGLLTNETDNGDGTKTWTWEQNQTIPTYLASVAVSDYETIEFVHEGLTGDIPVMYGARPQDTTNVKNSFVNMPQAIDAFEAAYGPYLFDRVGFTIVPFNGGAMEHATNIAYPLFAVNGTLGFEDLMAHEFAHHWWGDLVTTETASDMWINEGWASYSEHLFFESVYGVDRYKEEVRNNHESVMRYAHLFDGAHLPVANVPFDATYGSTVYNKGADVIHTMRGYMDDEVFFDCMKALLDDFAFKNINSAQFRDYLSDCSGTDMTDFFEDWMFAPGFPHFAIDSMNIDFVNDEFVANVFVRQKLLNAPHFYNNVPLEVTFFEFDLTTETHTIWVSGECSVHQVPLSFFPVLAALDLDEKINDATQDGLEIITGFGTYEFANTGMSVTVNEITDQTLVRVTHNFVTPDRPQTPLDGIVISDNRYWSVDIFNFGTFGASATIDYNGTNSTSNGYLDNALISASENLLKVFHRPSSAHDWQEVGGISINTQGSATDKRGRITIDPIQNGEYVLGIQDPSRVDTLTTSIPECLVVGIDEADRSASKPMLRMYPNPTKNSTLVQLGAAAHERTLQVYTVRGELVKTLDIAPGQSTVALKTDDLRPAIYMVQVWEEGKKKAVGKMVIVD